MDQSARWLPYFAIVIIGIVGVSWTNMLGVSVPAYWVTMTQLPPFSASA